MAGNKRHRSLLREEQFSRPPRGGRSRTLSDDIAFDSVIARLYLNPCLLDQECTSRVPKGLELPQKVEVIRGLIYDNLVHGIAGGEDVLESFTGGKLGLCGSVAEGTKVGGADEFDFQYLLTFDRLDARPKRLLRTKPHSADRTSLSFFSLRLPRDDGVSEEIEASAVQDRFLKRIKQLLGLQPVFDDLEIKKAGPAVKISFKDDGHIIKMDLTLGLRCGESNNTIAEHLTPLARSLDGEGRLYSHYVAANDYWKICFVDTEQELLREIIEKDEIKGAVYRIIKLLRDEADIKDPYGDGILPSYPIKVTFLDLAYQDHARDIAWSIQDVTFHVIKTLREVERRGLAHTLCCLFLKDDDVIAEGDRSYLESRRLLLELKRKEKFYCSLRYKRIFFLSSLLVFICSTTLAGCVLHVVLRMENDETAAQKSFVNGLFPVVFAAFCLDNLHLLLFKSERIFKLYPSWPISCLMSLIFQQVPLFAVSMVEHGTVLASCLWLTHYGSSLFLGCVVWSIVICNSCLGLFNRKSYFILDVTVLYLNIIRPYSWKSPGHQNIPYRPEIGHHTSSVRIIYILAILLCLLTGFVALFVGVVFIGVDAKLIPYTNPIYAALIGRSSERALCILLTPFALFLIVFLLGAISGVCQRNALRAYADRFFEG